VRALDDIRAGGDEAFALLGVGFGFLQLEHRILGGIAVVYAIAGLGADLLAVEPAAH
jgi:hypothetical protein